MEGKPQFEPIPDEDLDQLRGTSLSSRFIKIKVHGHGARCTALHSSVTAHNLITPKNVNIQEIKYVD